MIFVENSQSSREDYQLTEPPQWKVEEGYTSTQMRVWWLMGTGWLVNKEHTRQLSRLSWVLLRSLDSPADAYHLANLLQSGQVAPEDALTHELPGRPARSDVVDTVASIHQRLRRRRR